MHEAQADLEALIPALRKRLRMPRLEFVTVINQGDYLIEIPVERKDIPRVCYYQVMHMGSSADIEGGSSDLLGDIHTCRSFLDIYQAQSCHAL